MMDFNDLSARLRRLNDRLGQTVDTDVEKHLSVREKNSTLTREIRIDLAGGASPEHYENLVIGITEDIAKLKDHSRKRMRARGLEPKLVEDFVKGSEELSLIADLANAEKHGGGARNPYSGKNPSLRMVRPALRLTAHPGKPATAMYDPATGKFQMTGERAVVVNAEVVDEKGNLICSWEKMVEKGMEEWEGFLAAHGLTQDGESSDFSESDTQ